MKKEKYNFNPMSLAISIGVVFILISGVLLPVCYSFFGYKIKEIPTCASPIEHTCYRYVTTGGLLGGVSSFKTSCNNPHD